MAFVPQKSQYALRALFELAKNRGEDMVKVADIAKAQAIPPRFLEVILHQLKQGAFVESQRGSDGGYRLIPAPARLTVGEVLRFLQGPVTPVSCLAGDPDSRCPLQSGCVFLPMWERVKTAISEVYDGTTFQDLLDEESRRAADHVPTYCI